MSPSNLVAPAMPAPADREQGSPLGRAAFFQRPFVQNILPFLTSVSVHGIILVLGLLTYTAYQIINRPPLENQVSPVDTVLVDNGIHGLVGTTDKAWLETTQDKSMDNTDPHGISFNGGAQLTPAAAGGGSEGDAAVLALGPNAGFGKKGSGYGPGSGRGNGPGGDADGPLALFGKLQVGGIPNALFGPAGAHKVAFVCDASGSMINKMGSLKEELNKAIVGLRLSQSFSIVFFRDGQQRAEIFDTSLVRATPENKRRAGRFLEGAVAAGSTDPVPGIEAAFRQQPELIYLLTDGDFPDNDAVLSKIRELNKGNKIRVNTIAFVGSGDNDTAFIELLKTIARETGGTYRRVSESDL